MAHPAPERDPEPPPLSEWPHPEARTSFAILSPGEVSEWLMVPLSKSGVRKHRGFESHPLRQNARHQDADAFVGPLRSSHMGA
jgi:hypothetical protein